MTEGTEIRDSRPGDAALIETLYRDAFPEEDLLPLVRELLSEGPGVISLLGFADAALAGHAVFTMCRIAGETGTVALLGPVAVAPARQRQGIGSAIVRAGLRRLDDAGTDQVCVLGDPAWYRGFGFVAEDRVTPPYQLPDAWRGAWQSRSRSRDRPPLRGRLLVPEAWRKPALWGS